MAKKQRKDKPEESVKDVVGSVGAAIEAAARSLPPVVLAKVGVVVHTVNGSVRVFLDVAVFASMEMAKRLAAAALPKGVEWSGTEAGVFVPRSDYKGGDLHVGCLYIWPDKAPENAFFWAGAVAGEVGRLLKMPVGPERSNLNLKNEGSLLWLHAQLQDELLRVSQVAAFNLKEDAR